jgi:hypothetical protein
MWRISIDIKSSSSRHQAMVTYKLSHFFHTRNGLVRYELYRGWRSGKIPAPTLRAMIQTAYKQTRTSVRCCFKTLLAPKLIVNRPGNQRRAAPSEMLWQSVSRLRLFSLDRPAGLQLRQGRQLPFQARDIESAQQSDADPQQFAFFDSDPCL